MNCLLFGLVCVSLEVLVSAERITHHLVHVPKEGVEIPQDITQDTTENTVMIVIGDVSARECNEATVNYHDFNTGYVVFKDIRRQLCLLSKAPVSDATPAIYAEGRTSMTLAFDSKINHALMSHNDVTKVAGEKLANFCQDYRTYFRTLVPKGRYRRDASRDDGGPFTCSHNCGICLVSGLVAELDQL